MILLLAATAPDATPVTHNLWNDHPTAVFATAAAAVAGLLYLAFSGGTTFTGALHHTVFGTYIATLLFSGVVGAVLFFSLPVLFGDDTTGRAVAGSAAAVMFVVAALRLRGRRRHRRWRIPPLREQEFTSTERRGTGRSRRPGGR